MDGGVGLAGGFVDCWANVGKQEGASGLAGGNGASSGIDRWRSDAVAQQE